MCVSRLSDPLASLDLPAELRLIVSAFHTQWGGTQK